jgi:1,4-dihydroxy-2-naphthoate octaprenyltransferase
MNAAHVAPAKAGPQSRLGAWALATRPKTLITGMVPIIVGSSLAFHDHAFAPLAALVALAGALLIQIGTNLANDYYDFKRGADTSERVGPARATQQGWIAPRQVLMGALGCFASAVAVGMYLVSVAGWPILVVGLISVFAGYAYTGGPFPLGYNGLGDVFVLVFFGFVAVGGTYFVQALTVTPVALLAGVPVGALGVALLAVNNTRDAKTDVLAGKRTLVVRFGTRFGQWEYVAMVVLSALIPLGLWLSGQASAWVMASWLALPLSARPIRLLFTQQGAALNAALGATAGFQFIFCSLFALGLSR